MNGRDLKDPFGIVETKNVPLQAILFMDSFETKFRPITLECPKALFPLANVPMLEYSLEFLVKNNVKQVFLFCGWLGEKN